jgi:hypothetical protein
MKTLKDISLGDMYKKSEFFYPQEITGYYHSIHPVVVVVCVISTDQLRNSGFMDKCAASPQRFNDKTNLQ